MIAKLLLKIDDRSLIKNL